MSQLKNSNYSTFSNCLSNFGVTHPTSLAANINASCLLTDCIDFDDRFFDFSMYFIVRSFLCVLTARVSVCVCHAGIKGYLLT